MTHESGQKKMNRKKLVRVVVFGVFDCFHPGHRSFLRQARQYGRTLTVVVARDSMIKVLKGQKPQEGESKRLAAVRMAPGVTEAVLGDRKLGIYSILKRERPDVICLGYDQRALGKDLRMRMRRGEIPRIKTVWLFPHKPHRFKSSVVKHARS